MEQDADPQLVDQLAARLRAQSDDLSLYAGMLLNLVTTALPPELVTVEREKRRLGVLRRGEPAVTAVTVTLGEWSFRLARDGVGAAPVAHAQHVIRGIVLLREQLPLVPWSRRLASELSRVVARDADASLALEQLLHRSPAVTWPGPESDADAAGSAEALTHGRLPVGAVARLQQLRRTSSWTSEESAAGFAAIRGVGFEPVGQVLGATVDQIGYSGWGNCGIYGYTGTGSRYRWTADGNPPCVAYTTLVQALYAARHRAVRRLEQECVALGGDGVVGVRLTIRDFPGVAQALEFSVVGTAVRARGSGHPARPFLSDLSGQDFAKLLHSGWVPCGLVFGIAVAVRHDDYRTRAVTTSWRNGEVPGYTDLVHRVRGEARVKIEDAVARQGGTGLVMQTMTLRVREQECRQIEHARDHVAEARLIGTAVAPFRHDPGDTAEPLRIMRLDQPHDRLVGARLTRPESEFT